MIVHGLIHDCLLIFFGAASVVRHWSFIIPAILLAVGKMLMQWHFESQQRQLLEQERLQWQKEKTKYMHKG